LEVPWDNPLNEVLGVEAVDGSGRLQDVEAIEVIDLGEVGFEGPVMHSVEGWDIGNWQGFL